MFSCNFHQYFNSFSLNCFVIVSITITAIGAAAVAENGEFEPSNIVFTATTSFQRQRSFAILTSSAVSNDSVIELSRAAEAFSLEYFQVIFARISICKFVQEFSTPFPSFWNSVYRASKPTVIPMSSLHRYRFGRFYCCWLKDRPAARINNWPMCCDCRLI